MKAPVVVVGAGIIGCAIARELVVRGVAVTVVDPRPIGGGATQASAGMLAPYVEARDGGPMLDLCVRSLGMYDGWIAQLRAEGYEIDYARAGTLEIALSTERAAALRGGRGEWMEPEALAAAVPQLGPTAGALRNDEHGYVKARDLVGALGDSAQRRGVDFVEARVERVERRNGALRVDAGGARTIDAGAVVLAAGAWTNRIQGVRTPPIRPVRGQLLRISPGHDRIRTILWGPDCYIVPMLKGVDLLVGATVEDAGFSEETTDEGINALYEAARRLLPALPENPEDAHVDPLVGLRPAAPDDLPVLGADPAESGVFHASGHYRNGILLAPITAKLMADAIVDGSIDPALETFSPVRFF